MAVVLVGHPAPPDFRLGQATVPGAAVWQHVRTFWGATFDPACEAAVVEPSTCLYGPVWYPHVAARLPVLIQQSSIDAVFTGAHDIVAGQTAEQTAALAAWQEQAEASLVDVSWLFSGDTSYHVLSDPGFGGLELGPAGSTFREVIGRFWADGAPERVEF